MFLLLYVFVIVSSYRLHIIICLWSFPQELCFYNCKYHQIQCFKNIYPNYLYSTQNSRIEFLIIVFFINPTVMFSKGNIFHIWSQFLVLFFKNNQFFRDLSIQTINFIFFSVFEYGFSQWYFSYQYQLLLMEISYGICINM